MSYRQFVKTSLSRDALQEKNRNTPEGMRWCNALCQDYLSHDKFTSTQVICNQCRNILNIAEQKIQRNQITIEDFKENPMIVYNQTQPTQFKRTCHTCHQEKIITQFEFNRQICKSCRFLQQSLKNKENAQKYIQDIEEIKHNLPVLENFLRQIPKDTLILVNSHYQCGRKPTDNKNDVICNLMCHFRSLLNPNLCKAGCGSTVVQDHSICDACKEKPPNRRYEREKEFKDHLEEWIEDLLPIHDIDQYNKQQLSLIARKLDISFLQSIKKTELLEKINAVLIQREEERKMKRAEEELERRRNMNPFQDLVINEFRIQARSTDGYINATQLCRAGNKRFNHWISLDTTKEFIDVLSTDTGITASQLVDIKKGNSSHFTQGSWIHPDLATNLAQWISPLFGVRVSRWVREIILTGSTNVQPRTNEELLKLQMELQENQEKLKKLESNHKKLLHKREYHKFQTGSCFYILQADPEHYKIGVSDNLNDRLKTYRTSIPNMKVLYIMYSSKAPLLEQCLLSRYQDYRVENNHEFLTEISLLDLTGSIDTICKFMKFDVQVVPESEIRAYHET